MIFYYLLIDILVCDSSHISAEDKLFIFKRNICECNPTELRTRVAHRRIRSVERLMRKAFLAEIFNEKLKNIEYGNDTTRYSHRYYIDIQDKSDLDELIELIKEDDKHEESRYIFKKKK